VISTNVRQSEASLEIRRAKALGSASMRAGWLAVLISLSTPMIGVMVLRIVENNDHSFSASKILMVQLLQKLPTALSIEFFFFASVKEFSVA
jgi:hypothetical protein